MADVTVTAADVLPVTTGSNQTQTQRVIWGAAITQGQPVYEDSTDSFRCKPADTDSSQATANVRGIALNAGAAGQPGEIATAGEYDPGFTAVEGQIYVLSGTAGGIAPVADLAASDWVTYLGVGNAGGNIDLNIHATGSQVQ